MSQPIKTQHVHRLDADLLKRPVRILVVGCGGNGSEIVAGLPYLHQAMLAYGHPGGLDVLMMDGDVVSPTNIVRQAFSASDVGHPKAPILVNRLNAFWGLRWRAFPRHLEPDAPLVGDGHGGRRDRQRLGADIVIGCVDSRGARQIIRDRIQHDGQVRYWLDLGNDASSGQFILGVPHYGGTIRGTLMKADGAIVNPPTVADLYPETVDAAADKADTLPSCSAQEALTRQEPFVNRTLASHALALLARLFRYGEVTHHGAFVNLVSGKMVPVPVRPFYGQRPQRPPTKARKPLPTRRKRGRIRPRSRARA